MRTGKPGISSFDKFAIGGAIKSELRTMGGNLLGLNSTLMKLSNGDDESRASLDPAIGTRNVQKVSSRRIGGTASSKWGGVGPKSTPARTANLLGNPYMRRYEGPNANGRYNFGLDGSPAIGEYYDVYESEENHLRFLDETIGRDLLGYTHLVDSASERTGDPTTDEVYLRSTYSVFTNLEYPFDNQDIEAFRMGPKRYGPSDPYVLKPLESQLVRRTMNGEVQGFQDKFEAMTPDRPAYMGSMLDMWAYMGSHYYLNLLNGVAEHGIYVENYEYEPRNRVATYDLGAIPQSDYVYFLNVDSISPEKEIRGLLGKTNRMFYEGKIKSLANRFATLTPNNEGMPDFLNTATDHLYGLSRGRNLRKLDLTYENGYPNPYCRVWTTHYQYSKYKHLIRGKWADDSLNAGPDHYTLHQGDQLMRPNKGYERLKNMTSLDPENGRPIFTPYYVNDRNTFEKDSIKRCMFSIENLAWKDIMPEAVNIRKNNDEKREAMYVGGDIEFGDNSTSYTNTVMTRWGGNAKGFGMTLTEEQRGPNGGRIMWFPPYNLKFSEQAHANWNANEFIGRGEKIFSYVNSERTGTLSFTVLIDHPSIINEWARGGKMGKTANKTAPLSKDEMILRYFAGCDALEFNPREEYDVPYKKVDVMDSTFTETENDVEVSPGKEARKVEKEEQNPNPAITFYSVFYYPNDYSGGDFMGQKVSKATKDGSLDNLLPKEQQTTDYTAGLNEMFYEGKRSGSGKGYELGKGGSGMTYPDKGLPDGCYYVGPGKDGKTRKWFYPVDTRVNNEVLRNDARSNYKDTHDYHLNADFYGDFWKKEDVNSKEEDKFIEYLNGGNTGTIGPKDGGDLDTAKSLLKLTGDTYDNKYFVPAINFYENLKSVVTKLDAASNKSYSYEIEIQGYASSHGYGGSNDRLAENRANLIKGWIESLGCFDFGTKDKISANGNGQIADTGTKNGNDPESMFRAKAARAAVVTFKIIPDKTIITEAEEPAEDPIHDTVITESTEVNTYSIERYDTSAADDYENQTYDDEYLYFKQINENDDMVKRYISDKVDYFDPAFHSITPEGFNARLTFLHQCLRQGPTISASDLGRGSLYGAGNLSFGRAPFCVLRIGDFFNTKICIQSVNIEYDNGGGLQWDLNPEGVGLQPMLANVNITFTFLGGSDISGPISRLQNAVSFNYYANTSVYDRRADYRDGFVSPENDEAMTWSPIILNKDDNKNVIEHLPFYTRKPDPGDMGQ